MINGYEIMVDQLIKRRHELGMSQEQLSFEDWMCQIFNSQMGAVQACAIWFHAWLLGGSTWPTNQSHREMRGKLATKSRSMNVTAKPLLVNTVKYKHIGL